MGPLIIPDLQFPAGVLLTDTDTTHTPRCCQCPRSPPQCQTWSNSEGPRRLPSRPLPAFTGINYLFPCHKPH